MDVVDRRFDMPNPKRKDKKNDMRRIAKKGLSSLLGPEEKDASVLRERKRFRRKVQDRLKHVHANTTANSRLSSNLRYLNAFQPAQSGLTDQSVTQNPPQKEKNSTLNSSAQVNLTPGLAPVTSEDDTDSDSA